MPSTMTDCAPLAGNDQESNLEPDEELLRRVLRNLVFVVPRPDDREVPGDERTALLWMARARAGCGAWCSRRPR
jgi:hypothetical protein